ncbi:MAG: LamG-like jellyroll fold domain-containing protein, partial [Bacteroidales bacterium]
AKGWHLSVEGGNLRFRYAPANMFSQPTYEQSFTQQTELNAGSISNNQWHHIAVTHQRNGSVRIFVDGIQKSTAERILPNHTLNNAMNLGLFADGYERVMMEGEADELKIWNYALSPDEIKHTMYAFGGNSNPGLVYYNGFNENTFDANKETYSHVAPRIRKRAKANMISMPVFVSAQKAASGTLTDSVRFFTNDANQITIQAVDPAFSTEIHAYRYTPEQLLEFASNIDTAYYSVLSAGYQLKTFDEITAENDTVNLVF